MEVSFCPLGGIWQYLDTFWLPKPVAVTGIEEVVVAARDVVESSSVHRTITKNDLLEMPAVPRLRSW